MNFVGHAAVASWEDDDPRFCLGAMLPDLARMVGPGRAPRVRDDLVRRGVECHYRVDAAFHDLPAFVALSRRLREALRQAGVRRAPALAAAHVGVELLVDGALLRRDWVREQWAKTTRSARELPTTAIAWPADALARRFEAVCERLPEIAAGYLDVVTVTQRVLAILARRPRLAATLDDEPGIATALAALAPDIAAGTEHILDELALEIAAGRETRPR